MEDQTQNSLDHQAVRLAFLHAEKRTFFQGETDHNYSFSHEN